ncbi:putative transporter [Pelagibaculum spongiae]|uniref:Putative transporter n=1 Tax=Pelagibaculum spongiae TaxID=2080658 RepID=A0A2V1GQV0_9GAMM|nr:putative transporter [Pelagibaculum spongiae]PVZ64380.1 putative transporter [Pelagibaculum spongiae]
MSQIATSLVILSLVAVIGLWIGNFKIRGMGLGIGGVLFGGIIVGHFVYQNQIELNMESLHFIQEFGLILFVYTIGIQVGPGFFASLRSSGLKLNALAASIVVLGCVVAVAVQQIFDLELPVILGIYSGAVTNTPSLAAGGQILAELGASSEALTVPGLGYAVAYPFGICGILLTMSLVRLFFKINIDKEAEQFEHQNSKSGQALQTRNLRVSNPNLIGMALSNVPALNDGEVVCSRLKRGENLMVPKPDTLLAENDLIHLVGKDELLDKVQVVVGEPVDEDLTTHGSTMKSIRVVVTEEKILGKTLNELGIKQKYEVVVSRLNRTGVELVPSRDMSLEFGDILNIVGTQEDLDEVSKLVGNVRRKLQQVQMMPIFIGIGLGVLLGSIPFQLPNLPAPLKLGLAGGPLLVAIILSRIGSIGRLYWFMPPSANLALREVGIVLFLAVVGLKSGAHFMDVLVGGDGLMWMLYGIFVTLIPLMIVGIVGRWYLKLNYLTLCGTLAGSMTDPPALAFANSLHPTSGASALAYATVYPLVMCLRILSPQIMAILLWSAGAG